MKSTLYSLFLMVMFSASVQAQKVATIGVDQIRVGETLGSHQWLKKSIVVDLDRALNEALAKTRKFKVLNFAQLTARMKEQSLSLDGFYARSDSNNRYQQAGLDYILTATVSEFGVSNLESSTSKKSLNSLGIDFRLIGVADLTADFESTVLADYSNKLTSDNKNILDHGADQLVNQLVTKLFPIRIISISEQSSLITLNYGEGFLQPGDEVVIYPFGQEILVNAKGQPLGQSIATLQVDTTSQKFAKARAVKGWEALRRGQEGVVRMPRFSQQKPNVE